MSYSALVAIRDPERRLGKLLEDRSQPGADKDEIDARIWDLFGEDWCIMVTDLSGFSKSAAQHGIIHFMQVIYESQSLFVPIIESHNGHIVKTEADSLIVIFRDADKALSCAFALREASENINANRADSEKILVGIGLGAGRILKVGDSEIFGFQVNAASKLGEDTAKDGEILITRQFADIHGGLDSDALAPIADVPGSAEAAFRVVNSTSAR